MRNIKLALVAVLAVALLSLAGVKAEPAATAQSDEQTVRSAT